MAKGVILEGVKDSYKILISYNCQTDIEEHMGAESVYTIMGENFTAKFMRLVIKYGLEYGSDKKVNLKEVGNIIDDILAKNDILYLRSKITQALNDGLGMDKITEDVEETEGK